MAGLTELDGSLIQMNVHMMMNKGAEAMFIVGIFLGIACIVGILCYLDDVKKWWKIIVTLTVLLCIFAGMSCWAFYMPREKIIMACVNGPISIERISGVYDILEIDGKMLKLRER